MDTETMSIIFIDQFFYTALVTLPERKQRVQAYTRFGVPLTSAFTRLIFGFQDSVGTSVGVGNLDAERIRPFRKFHI